MSREIIQTGKLEEIANRIRIKVVKMIACSGIGHAGGAVSMAEILAVLYFGELNIDPKNPGWPDRDRFILSKGHGCPALYAVFSEVGLISEDLLPTLHDIDSPLQMHPELGLCPGIEMSTGPLGQGLSAGIGMALGARLRRKAFRVYVLVGDGESAEGQVWEAAMFAGNYGLDNLVAILDYNGFSLTDRVANVMPLEPLKNKYEAFGWHVLEVDGHNIREVIDACQHAQSIYEEPVMIICHTIPGKGVDFMEWKPEWHGKTSNQEEAMDALRQIRTLQGQITSETE